MNEPVLFRVPAAVLAILISLPLAASQLPGKTASASEAQPTHHATGLIESIDPRNRRVTVAHDPVPSLRWPSMSMDFALKDGWSAVGLQPGDRVSFELTPSGADYVIVSLEKAAPTSSGDSSPRASGRNGMQSHRGHGMHSGGHGMHGMHSMGMMCDEMVGGKSVWREMMEGMLGRR